MENLKCNYCEASLGPMENLCIVIGTHSCFDGISKIYIDDQKKVIGVEDTEILEEDKENIAEKDAISNESNKWSHKAIISLISVFKEQYSKFNSPQYNHKQVWNIISKDLEKYKICTSAAKCDEKWRNLKKTYEKVLKQNNETGSKRKTWPYFEELHEIYFNHPQIKPIATCSNILGNTPDIKEPKRLKRGYNLEGETSATPGCTGDLETTRKRKSKIDEVERRHRERLEEKERRHKERLQQKEKMFDWFKNYCKEKEK